MSTVRLPTLNSSDKVRSSLIDYTMIGYRGAGAETMPRWAATSMTSISMGSGVVRFGYFTAPRADTVTRISMSTGTTAAGATPTLVKYGLYSVATNGDLTQLAVTTNDTSVFAAALTTYSRNLGSSVTLTEGSRYAVAAIVVTGAAAPSVTGALCATGTDNGQAPVLAMSLTGQSDLQASYTAGSLTASQSFVYAAALP